MHYLEKLFGLKGKIAALTGAAGHLIGTLSKGMAKAGMKVAMLDIDEKNLQAVEAQIKAEGGDALSFRMDVTQKTDFQNALRKIIEKYGKVDVLVNGAGINAPTPFLQIPLEEWNRILAVQLTGTMLGCQIFGEYMVSRKKGAIVNISSASAGPPLSKAFTYSVAKAGIWNLTQNLAREWAEVGVRVNALRPGFFPTEWNKKNFLSPDRIQAIMNHTPMKRFGEPEELMGAVLWLVSDAASFVTGVEIIVDGGFLAMTI